LKLVKTSKPGYPAAMTSQALNRPAPEIVEVTTRRVDCDGGKGQLGHPRVFLSIGADGFIDCTYCDRRFQLKAGAGGHGH
jgi:uncharacterized Zn-finger protein